MSIESLARTVAKKMPGTAPILKAGYRQRERIITGVGGIWPGVVRAQTEKITIAITAHCNLR
jgi:O-acetyl-ADP-ribose deacetylase (regulator of RNase III)